MDPDVRELTFAIRQLAERINTIITDHEDRLRRLEFGYEPQHKVGENSALTTVIKKP